MYFYATPKLDVIVCLYGVPRFQRDANYRNKYEDSNHNNY